MGPLIILITHIHVYTHACTHAHTCRHARARTRTYTHIKVSQRTMRWVQLYSIGAAPAHRVDVGVANLAPVVEIGRPAVKVNLDCVGPDVDGANRRHTCHTRILYVHGLQTHANAHVIDSRGQRCSGLIARDHATFLQILI